MSEIPLVGRNNEHYIYCLIPKHLYKNLMLRALAGVLYLETKDIKKRINKILSAQNLRQWRLQVVGFRHQCIPLALQEGPYHVEYLPMPICCMPDCKHWQKMVGMHWNTFMHESFTIVTNT